MEENEKSMQKMSDEDLENVVGGYERRTPIEGFDKGFFRPKSVSSFKRNNAIIDPSHAHEDDSELLDDEV